MSDLVSAGCNGKWYVHCVPVSCKHLRKVLSIYVHFTATSRLPKWDIQGVKIARGACLCQDKPPQAVTQNWPMKLCIMRISATLSDAVLWIVMACSMQLSQETHHSSSDKMLGQAPHHELMTCHDMLAWSGTFWMRNIPLWWHLTPF